jgi:lysophospholipase L1-like esterase
VGDVGESERPRSGAGRRGTRRVEHSRSRRWRGVGMAAVLTTAAVASVGPATGASPRNRPAPRPATATTATATGVELPRGLAPGGRVLVIGDSLAESLIPGLEASANAAGAQLLSRAFGGCGLLTGVPIDPTGQPYPWGQACNDSRPGWQSQAVQDLHPDVVMWLGAAWDERDRLVNGLDAQIGTVAGDQIILGLIDQAAQRLTSTGARLVIVTAAPDRGSQLAADPARNARLTELNRLLRLYAAFHQIQVVDLAPIICPGGAAPECPETVNGVVMRPDGYHVGASAAPVIAQQVLPVVLGGAGPLPADGDVAPSTFAGLNQRAPTALWSEISHPWRVTTTA